MQSTLFQSVQTNASVQSAPWFNQYPSVPDIESTDEEPTTDPNALEFRPVDSWREFSLATEFFLGQSVPESKVRIVVSKEQADRARFFNLLEQWDLQKGFTSSQDKIEACPAHLGILAMGWDVVPLIMEQIENGVMNHWFTALGLITCENPVPVEDRGNYSKMGETWLKWWKQQN